MNKNVAKNTLFLYVRMLFSMLVTLYTSRIVLEVLGISDLGLYTVVGGVVTLFSFANTAMSSATQRFLSFEIGTGNREKLQKTFNATLNIQILTGLIIFILAETIGLWFVNNKLNLPGDRIDSVNWIYQFSILTFLVGVLRIPYNALIIAHERMVVYAYMSIVEVICKLGAVYLLFVIHYDKLKLYSLLIFSITTLITFFYCGYCIKNFSESRYKFSLDTKLYKTLLAYSGWNLFGNIAFVAKGQGVNMILNIFFGTVVNAAYGIAMQAFSAVNMFMTNFQLAMNPQIVKNYANKNSERTLNLIYQGSKLSFFLVYTLAIPILFETDFILELWLKTTPVYTSIFIRLAIINLLIESLSGTLMTGAQATGKIKTYQIVVGTLLLLNLPLSYLVFKLYNVPELTFWISILISVCALLLRLYFLKRLIGLSVKTYLRKVVGKIASVIFITISVPIIIQYTIIQDGLFRLLMMCICTMICNLTAIYLLGIEKVEREVLREQFLKRKR